MKKLGNILLIFLAIGISSGIFLVIDNYNYDTQYSENFETVELNNVKQDVFPDIYYIILDEYAGNYSLTKNFNYNNEEFLTALAERGFFIPSNNFSNYPYTALSLPSILNLQYIDFISQEMDEKSSDLKSLKQLRERNLVVKNLNLVGYHTVSFYSGAGNVPLEVDERLCKDENKRAEILCTFSEMPKLKERISKPLFAYSHMSLPHDPYVFDKNGNEVIFDSKNAEDEREFYLEQLKFTNKKTIEFIDSIINDKEYSPIIILQSDHGERIGVNWENPTNEMILQSFNNFNAYYMPGIEQESILYDDITPVNTFRVVFNAYFDQELELLEDRHFWFTSDKKPYKSFEVTDIINEFRS